MEIKIRDLFVVKRVGYLPGVHVLNSDEMYFKVFGIASWSDGCCLLGLVVPNKLIICIYYCDETLFRNIWHITISVKIYDIL
jgi:hypothetical protein